MRTEVVYVCTADYWRYLFMSLRTLLHSNPDLESVRVFIVGPPKILRIPDNRVHIEFLSDDSAEGPWGRYWGTNKLQLKHSRADRVIYLDTDVLVLGRLDGLYRDSSADVIARVAPEVVSKKHWDAALWASAMHDMGAPKDMPFYSPGFIIFQNASHKRIAEHWRSAIDDILRDSSPLPRNKHAEMYAFSVGIGRANASHDRMPDHGHRYAMIGEEPDDATVYHLGTPGFFRHLLRTEKRMQIDSDAPAVPRPRFLHLHDLRSRARQRLRRMLRGGRREDFLDEY